MNIKTHVPPIQKKLSGIMILAILISTFGVGSPTVNVQAASVMTAYHVLSDGQFVYGPNIGDFKIREFLEVSAPHLLKYADDLYGRSEYFSINPKIYLTLLEIHSHLISVPDPALMGSSLGLNSGGFITQIEYLSEIMAEAYYLHLYTFSALPVSQRNLPSFVAPNGAVIHAAPGTNAGTYAIMAGLAATNQQDFYLMLDNNQVNGFYQTYVRLFPNDNPLDEKNQILMPGEVSALAAPDFLLQLPYLQGVSWRFGGVHDNNGCSGISVISQNGCDFLNASAMDFYPAGSAWGIDTSNMWVVAAASGTPTRISDCSFKILHGSGWETNYYHLESAKFLTGSINQNDKIGVIANTLAEATCNGGASTGPHVHFTLRRNGALYAINGTALSGWFVHAGRWSYDTDAAYMWLERAGVKKYPSNPYYHVVLSEAPPLPPMVISSMRADIDPTSSANVNFTVTFSENVTGVDASGFTLTTGGVSGATVSGVSGSGSVYTVTVNTGSGDGTIRLNVVDNNSIADATGNLLGGDAMGDGNFTTGEAYTISKKIPPINFSDQLFHTSNPPTVVTIPNTHGTDIHIGTLLGSASVGTTWNTAQDFFIENDTCSGATVIPSGSCTFKVRFLPWSLGAKSGTITVPSDAPDQPYIVALSGNSIAGTQLLTNRSFDSYSAVTNLPDLWTVSPGIKVGIDTVDSSWAFNGPLSFKFVGDGDLKILSQTINKAGVAGDDFSFNVMTKGVGIPVNAQRWLLQVMFLNNGVTVENRNIPLTTGTFSNARLTRMYTAVSSYNQILFRIHYGKSSGTAWVDLANLQWAP